MYIHSTADTKIRRPLPRPAFLSEVLTIQLFTHRKNVMKICVLFEYSGGSADTFISILNYYIKYASVLVGNVLYISILFQEVYVFTLDKFVTAHFFLQISVS